MNLGFSFFLKSIMLGIGLAMDAFSVSLANGLNEPTMKQKKMCGVASVFAIFQFVMPMAGWICVLQLQKFFVLFKNLFRGLRWFCSATLVEKCFTKELKIKILMKKKKLV